VAEATDADRVSAELFRKAREVFDFANGGADALTLHRADLLDFDCQNVNFEGIGLSNILKIEGGTGETDELDLFAADGWGAADTVTVNGTNGDDVFGAAGDAGGVNVFGLQAAVNIFFQEQANDRLTLNALGGDDVVNASSLEADGIQLTENGGLGEDILIGSEGGDLINGGDGNDTALMGAGDDTFVWNPGDDNDTLEGQDGFDTMLFNGANIAEAIDISGNGERARFFRNIANVTMDLNDVERIAFNALGGADNIVVNDLSGTDVTEIAIDLAGAIGGTAGDGAALRAGKVDGHRALGGVEGPEEVAAVDAELGVDPVTVILGQPPRAVCRHAAALFTITLP
jgi:hypothetical protein